MQIASVIRLYYNVIIVYLFENRFLVCSNVFLKEQKDLSVEEDDSVNQIYDIEGEFIISLSKIGQQFFCYIMFVELVNEEFYFDWVVDIIGVDNNLDGWYIGPNVNCLYLLLYQESSFVGQG